jgi:hypothetical protein
MAIDYGDYPASSVGGQAIKRGYDKFMKGETPYKGWPFLEQRGWYQAKEQSK